MKTIGIVEFNKIPIGLENLDKVLKKSSISIYKGGVTCPGKYYFLIYGDNEEVNTAFEILEGELKFEIISGISSKLIEVFERKNKRVVGSSIGVVEFSTISESVRALDMIVKSNNVDVLKLVLGERLAGKSYFVISGDTSSILEAIQGIEGKINYRAKSIINNPSENIIKFI